MQEVIEEVVMQEEVMQAEVLEEAAMQEEVMEEEGGITCGEEALSGRSRQRSH